MSNITLEGRVEILETELDKAIGYLDTLSDQLARSAALNTKLAGEVVKLKKYIDSSYR
jgi:hypothetical protein